MAARAFITFVGMGICFAAAGCVLGAPVYQAADLRGAWVRQGDQEMVLVFNTKGNLVSISGDLIGVPGADGQQDALSATTAMSPAGLATVIIQYQGSSWELIGELTTPTSLVGRELIRQGDSTVVNDVSFVRVD